MFNKLRRRFEELMRTRNGIDELGQFLIVTSAVLLVISFFLRQMLLSIIAYALLIYAYFRVFSKNRIARQEENRRYIGEREHLRFRFQTMKMRWSMRKTHVYITCKDCKQKMRVPKGKGKIEITCPKCRRKFIKKT